MSLNLNAITNDLTHRYRAVGVLTGLTAVFLRCALVLMGGQNHQAVGAEILVVSGIAGVVFLGGYVRAVTSRQTISPPSLYRTIGGTSCYLAEVIGAAMLVAGWISGLYVVAAAIVVNFYFTISGAWLLLVGVSRDDGEQVPGASR